ncbi:MAG: WecB/TagA/CpsF family glycosyltransferase [Clostridiales bacterium]|jgi:N-acetylglucosaminyldiphosphoundecaprenol N-acetyl-beta-D-mannosaminyltransferase|nr:WecB/TagA/CpsF family glycosyltransferase [Clostridiales bacterium]MDR2752245.1 WecB/TagA/CpsF family glycosyltransferase [Clostridiales bacterium]
MKEDSFKRMRIDILSVPVDNVDQGEALDRLAEFMGEKKARVLVTPNPEMIMLAQSDPSYLRVLQKAELVAPDGIGVILASKMGGKPLKCRVTGCDLMVALMERMAKEGKSAYFLGAAPGIAEKAKLAMELKFPGLKITGTQNGYFDKDQEKLICSDIFEKRPDLLMLGLSMGKAELWADSHRDLPVGVIACIGGTLDVLAGNVKRAPAPMRKAGLEWLWRLCSQPSRAKRQMALPVFAWKIFKDYVVGKREM